MIVIASLLYVIILKGDRNRASTDSDQSTMQAHEESENQTWKNSLESFLK